MFVVLALAMFEIFNIDFSRYSRFQVNNASAARLYRVHDGLHRRAPGRGVSHRSSSGRSVFERPVMRRSPRGARTAVPAWRRHGDPVADRGRWHRRTAEAGHWMVRVKQAFGVFILGMAVYYSYLAYELFAARHVNAADVQSSVADKLKEGGTPICRKDWPSPNANRNPC